MQRKSNINRLIVNNGLPPNLIYQEPSSSTCPLPHELKLLLFYADRSIERISSW